MSIQFKYAPKLCWRNRYKVKSQLIAILYFFSSVSCLVPLIVGAEAKPNPASPIRVEVEQGRLTISVHDAPLAEVLQAIGEKAGIAIEIRGDLTARITESLSNVPLDEGVRQLLRDQSFAIKYGSPVDALKKQQLSNNRPTPLTVDPKKIWVSRPERQWFLQVSSSPIQSDAIRLVAALRAKGYQAFFVPALVRGRVWHRVRLGPLRTEEEARTLRQLIVSMEQFRDAFIGRDAQTVAQAKKSQETIPQAQAAGSNSAALQRTNPVEIAVLAEARVGLERQAENVATPGDAREVLEMIQALARRKDAEALGELSIFAVSDPNPTVRSQAVSALGRLGNQEALAPLTRALSDQSSPVRIQAMRGIRNLKGTEAIAELHGIVVNDPDPIVRRQALRLLSAMESAEVLGVLNGAIKDQDGAVSLEASEAVKMWEQRFGGRYTVAGGTR